jgi:hypothetical protein
LSVLETSISWLDSTALRVGSGAGVCPEPTLSAVESSQDMEVSNTDKRRGSVPDFGMDSPTVRVGESIPKSGTDPRRLSVLETSISWLDSTALRVPQPRGDLVMAATPLA